MSYFTIPVDIFTIPEDVEPLELVVTQDTVVGFIAGGLTPGASSISKSANQLCHTYFPRIAWSFFESCVAFDAMISFCMVSMIGYSAARFSFMILTIYPWQFASF